MAQKLALPLNKCTIHAMYKGDSNPAYQHEYTASGHFGLDMTGTYNPFYASGTGKVLGKGGTATTGVGYWVAIQYDNVYKWNMSNTSLSIVPSIVMRYFHLASPCKLREGAPVDLDTIVGTYGSTGQLKMSPHLHIEVDTDITYYNYTPTLDGAAGGLYKGTRGAGDTTFDPCSVLFRKSSSPELQTLSYKQTYCDIHGTSEPYINTAKVNKLKTKTF